METLIFGILAIRNGMRQQQTVVPEPAEFRRFDLRALKRSYAAEDDPSSGPSGRMEPLAA
ncbi:MAG: hypothetical protein JOZ60_13105 [Verrucomicrobia bacterium]|nr:hypothetical protein [Verrucomicrobiota bacterium]